MSTALAMSDDGLTIEFDGVDDRPDLTADEAEEVTGRIRSWVNDFPVDDVVLAFRGRVWLALSYASWSEWCECELGGLKLPAPKRREVVSELTEAGMSNRAIADTIGVSEGTVRNDHRSGAQDYAPERTVLGPDGKQYPVRPQPKSDVPQPETVDAEIVCRDCDGYGCETCVPDDQTESVEDSDNTTLAQHKEPRRKPITEAFTIAAMDLTKVTNRITSLSKDDRFERNADQIALRVSDLVRARDALQCVIDKFNL